MIELPEWSTATHSLAPISVDAQEHMTRTLGSRVGVSWLSDDRVRISSTSWVGTAQLTSGLHIRVAPKLAGDSLGVLTMLAITDGAALQDMPEYFRGLSTVDVDDAVQLLCRLVVVHTERVLRRGLIRDYRSHAEDLPFLRGRLDGYRQATKHYGKFTAIACTYDEFDHDTMENHLLLAGVRTARRATADPRLRRRAAELEGRLLDIAPTLPSRRELLTDQVVYGRRNAHYRTAHTWCRSLLRLGQAEDTDIPNAPRIETFLINMNALFERFVDWLVAQALSEQPFDLQAQKRNPSVIKVDGQTRRSIAPDLVVGHEQRRFAIDAKYKLYDGADISPSDTYQLLLYAQCYTGFTKVPTSYLIYPTSGSSSVQSTTELTVPRGVGPSESVRVIAIGIPLARIVAGLRSRDDAPRSEVLADLRRTLPALDANCELAPRVTS